MTTCGQVAFAAGCANNAVLVHLNRVVARKTPDLLMFGISPITQTRNVCTSPRPRKQGKYVLLLDRANRECVYFSSITQMTKQKRFHTNSRTAGFRRPHYKSGMLMRAYWVFSETEIFCAVAGFTRCGLVKMR
ncbi:MAG: hypothetical protein QOE55_3107 [Acidobacteriaceae bacterium]|nr:hypothetical protein [Acidobacteriaceae bacterium]